jgi:hypothetical protein
MGQAGGCGRTGNILWRCEEQRQCASVALRLHSRSHVHGFAPHIIGDARFPDHTGNRRAAMNADPQCQPAITERRTFVDHLKHGKGKPGDPNRSSNALSLQTGPCAPILRNRNSLQAVSQIKPLDVAKDRCISPLQAHWRCSLILTDAARSRYGRANPARSKPPG